MSMLGRPFRGSLAETFEGRWDIRLGDRLEMVEGQWQLTIQLCPPLVSRSEARRHLVSVGILIVHSIPIKLSGAD